MRNHTDYTLMSWVRSLRLMGCNAHCQKCINEESHDWLVGWSYVCWLVGLVRMLIGWIVGLLVDCIVRLASNVDEFRVQGRPTGFHVVAAAAAGWSPGNNQ